MRGLSHSLRVRRCCLRCAALGTAAARAAAAGSYSPYDETAVGRACALRARAGRQPRISTALIGAGRAALESATPRPRRLLRPRRRGQSAQPAAPGRHGRGRGRQRRAARRHCPISPARSSSARRVTTFGADRGLAYDLLGRQAEAQADYRAALLGADDDEARRRLALSLAISGERPARSTTLAPLIAQARCRREPRARAFVLALTGDSAAPWRRSTRQCRAARRRLAPFLAAAAGAQRRRRRPPRSISAFSRTPADTRYAYAVAADAPTRRAGSRRRDSTGRSSTPPPPPVPPASRCTAAQPARCRR